MLGMDYQDARSLVLTGAHKLTLYINSTNLDSLVIGVSGGIDSAVTAAITQLSILQYCSKPIKLYGRSITIDSNTHDEISRSHMVGTEFCNDFTEMDLTERYHSLINEKTLSDPAICISNQSKEAKIRRGNIKARMRMMELYDLAYATNGMVLSTDNLTEYYLGFWTLHGDVGDYGIIQNLWKTEVYDLAEYFYEYSPEASPAQKAAIKACALANPTDGLGVSDGDLSQIIGDIKFNNHREGYAYVDTVLRDYLHKTNSFSGKQIVDRYLSTKYKRSNPYSIPRKELISGSKVPI